MGKEGKGRTVHALRHVDFSLAGVPVWVAALAVLAAVVVPVVAVAEVTVSFEYDDACLAAGIGYGQTVVRASGGIAVVAANAWQTSLGLAQDAVPFRAGIDSPRITIMLDWAERICSGGQEDPHVGHRHFRDHLLSDSCAPFDSVDRVVGGCGRSQGQHRESHDEGTGGHHTLGLQVGFHVAFLCPFWVSQDFVCLEQSPGSSQAPLTLVVFLGIVYV